MYIRRGLEAQALGLAKVFPVVVAVGARQTGKTTMLERLFPKHARVSLDLPSLAERADSDAAAFLREHPAPLLLDEVQYAPKLFRHLKAVVDASRHAMGAYVLTGSQKFTLMKEVSESLAGRAGLLNVETLSLRDLEIDAAGDFAHVLHRGLFPELWRSPQTPVRDFYHSYIATYLERDVRQILNVQNLRDFERFLRACAARSAQLLNVSELARDVGIKAQTARDWLSVLEASNQITLLEPYFENVGKRIVKSPKLYLNDSGLLCALLAVDARAATEGPLVGAIWETLVFAELRKCIAASGAEASLWFYRDGQGREVDFVVQIHGRLNLLEVKWSDDPDERWALQMADIERALMASRMYRMGRKYVVGRIAHDVTRHDAVFTNVVRIADHLGFVGTA